MRRGMPELVRGMKAVIRPAMGSQVKITKVRQII
jgi:hypothetical protein